MRTIRAQDVRGRIGWHAAAVLAAILAGAAGAPATDTVATEGESAESLLERASACTERSNQAAEGLGLAEKVLAHAKATPKQKLGAFGVMLTIRLKQRKPADVAEIARRMTAAFPGDPAILARAVLAQAEAVGNNARLRTEAISALEAALPKLQADKAAGASVRARLARLYREAGKRQEAYEHARAAFESNALPVERAAEVLRDMSDAAWDSGDMPRCEQAVAQLLGDPYFGALQDWERTGQQDRYGEVLKKQGKFDQAREFYLKLAAAEKDPRRTQRLQLLIADLALEAKDYDAAIAAYDRAFLGRGDVTDGWYDAQARMVQALRAKGDYPAALKAARICLDAAWDSGRLQSAVQTTAEMLKAADGNVRRANELILLHKFGPAGEDGKAGTADDLANPLEGVGYPSYTQRETAFVATRKEAGDDAYAWRFRAQTYLYSGHPKDALRCYLDAMARSTPEEFGRIGRETVVVGVRAVQGHPHGLDRFYEFITYGPAGQDGTAGTADDLRDPFAELGAKTSAAEAEMSADDLAALRKAQELLRELAGRDVESADLRQEALQGLMRVQLALNDWPAETGPDWCLRQLMKRPYDGRHVTVWAEAGQLAARGGACHLGGIRQFWGRFDALDAYRDRKAPRDLDRFRTELRRVSSYFEKPEAILPRGLRTFALDPRELNLTNLQPFPPDKKAP